MRSGIVCIRRKLLFPIIVMSLILLCCGSDKKRQKHTNNQITLAHDKGIVSDFQNFFEKQGQKAKEETGISINPVAFKSSEVFIDHMKTVLPTADAPELFTWWSTYRVKELVEQGLVMDVSALWNKYHSEYPTGLRNAFTIDNKVYGFPYIVEYWAVWYSKAIFKELHIQAPQTWREFIDICEKLKSNNIAPILSSLQGRWPSFIWFEEMIVGEDPQLYVDLCEGRAKYTDPRVRKAFERWASMIKNGYFTNPDARMFTNVGHLWKTKQIGMVLCGSWYYSSALIPQGIPAEDIGVFILPSHNPTAGNNIITESLAVFLAENATHRQAALKVADWWMTTAGNRNFARLAQSFTANSKADMRYLHPAKKNLLSTIKSEKVRILNRYWEATPTPISDYAVDKFAEFILNPEKLDTVLVDIENVAAAYWKSHKKTEKNP